MDTGLTTLKETLPSPLRLMSMSASPEVPPSQVRNAGSVSEPKLSRLPLGKNMSEASAASGSALTISAHCLSGRQFIWPYSHRSAAVSSRP